MRIYLHLVNHHETIQDREGVEVADLYQAFAEVLQALALLWHEDTFAPQKWAGWTMNVTDGWGTLVLSVNLGSDIATCLRPS
jgi:hypothetical protein